MNSFIVLCIYLNKGRKFVELLRKGEDVQKTFFAKNYQDIQNRFQKCKYRGKKVVWGATLIFFRRPLPLFWSR